MTRNCTRRMCLTSAILLTSPLALAVTNTWDGSEDVSWFTDLNWDQNEYPKAGHHVVIPNTLNEPLLTNSTDSLGSLSIEGNTLTFTNWGSSLTATNVTVKSNGIITHSPNTASTTNALGKWVPDGRVRILCSNLTVESGGKIRADALGYAAAKGPGGGREISNRSSGGSHGGRGGSSSYYSGLAGRDPYGSAGIPVDPGSGGGDPNVGGRGGGLIQIEADGTITVNGTISASGGNAGSYSGGGAGGGIYLKCHTFGGTTGIIQAKGGNYSGLAGGGGGGRIAADYQNLDTPHTVQFVGSGGTSWADSKAGDGWHDTARGGTLYLSKTNLLSSVLAENRFTDINFLAPNFTAWTVADLSVSNCSLTFANPGFELTVLGDLRIDSGGRLGIGQEDCTSSVTLVCGNDLILTNGGTLHVYSGITNGTPNDYGALLRVTNTLAIGPSSWLYPYANSTNGSAPLLIVEDLLLAAGGGINASGRGFDVLLGPGAGVIHSQRNSGGGYGGQGSAGALDFGGVDGFPYGSVSRPIDVGSGGSKAGGGRGGGGVRIEANGTVGVDGTIAANGQTRISDSSYLGAGSGGGIYIRCDTFGGANSGLISVNGGAAASGGLSGAGGGGRAAVHYQNLSGSPKVRFSATPGTGYIDALYPPDDIWHVNAHRGTLYLPDTNLLSEVVTDNQFTDLTLYISNLTSMTMNSLTVSNCSLVLGNTNLTLTIDSDLTIGTNGVFGISSNSTLNVGQDLILSDGGDLYVYSGKTNGVPEEYGARVHVTRNIEMSGSAWVYVYSHGTDGGSPLFETRGLSIADTNSGFNANARGFAGNQGPGKGGGAATTTGGGGGYGGRGGKAGTVAGGVAYGFTNAPTATGSGGGGYKRSAGRGGGYVHIEAAQGGVNLNGTITAHGGNATTAYSAAGSGGSIYLFCGSFQGSANGSLDASGGNPVGGPTYGDGGGGGGRIAVWIDVTEGGRQKILADQDIEVTFTTNYAAFLGDTSVTGGIGWANAPASGSPVLPDDLAQEGSKVFIEGPPAGTLILVW